MRRKQPNFPGTAFEDESEPVCVAVVTARAEAELIVGMLRSGGCEQRRQRMMPEVGSRSCSSMAFRCWSRAPTKPRRVSASPTSRTTPGRRRQPPD